MLQEDFAMRRKKSVDGLTVQAIAGTYVVLLGFHMKKEDCPGLLGFSVHRTDHTENEAAFLQGMKCFAETDPGFPDGSSYSTKLHPVQSFGWSDYTAKPGHRYTYTVTALKGSPAALVAVATVAIDIETEDPLGGDHDVYFNSGVAGSQAYVRRFGDRRPEQVPNNAAFNWLSRGLFEAMKDFVAKAVDNRFELRVAVYEFHYRPLLDCLKQAADRGVTLKIVYDRREESPGKANDDAVDAAGLRAFSTRRTVGSGISHNKFMVLFENGTPRAVWTGGANISEGGIFGHSNVAHVVEDDAVAQAYADYWTLLQADPKTAKLRPDVDGLSPLPANPRPPVGTTPIFSPRGSQAALQWYQGLALSAKDGLFMTFAFGINDTFKTVYRDGRAPLRFALLEKKTRSMKAGPERVAEERAIDVLRRDKANIFAIGHHLRTNKLDGWVMEKLTGLNKNVQYVHNKFMLVDPLSDDPIVVAGSANFSTASTVDNDENMVIVRGNKRLADIYLGEFMRLYSHHAFRESLTFNQPQQDAKHLIANDGWWANSFGDTPRSRRRAYFAGVPFD